MEEENDDFGMSLFGNPNELEVNFDGLDPSFFEDQEEGQEQEQESVEGEETTPTTENINPDDDESQEAVVGDEDKEGDETQDDTSPNPYSSFASVLSKQGLLPSLDLSDESVKIESEEDLVNVFKKELDTQAKDYIINKVGQDGFEALEKGISLAEFQQHQDNVFTLEGITEDVIESDLELSKKIIYQDYLAQGFDDTRAMRLLKKSIDAGEESIIEDAKESLESLKLSENKRMTVLAEQRAAEKANQVAQQEKIDNDLKNAIYNTDEFIKGQKVNKATQDRVYQSITKIVGKDPNGVMENQLMQDRRKNPVEFDTKLYYLYELTKGFTDFQLIENKTRTKASNEFEKALKGFKFDNSGTSPSYMSDPDSYSGGIGSEIVL